MNSFRKRLDENGMTLVELIIAMAIIALTLAFAGPSLENYTKSQRVKNARREIYTMLQMARMTAIKENVDVIATFTMNQGSESLAVDRDEDLDGIPDGTQESLVALKDFFSEKSTAGVRISEDGSGPTASATFQSDGTSKDALVFEFTHDESEESSGYTLTVNYGGGLSLGKL